MNIATLPDALARIAELEAELASRPKPRKPRAVKATVTPCQYCGDTKTAKRSFLGLPMCLEWKPCASRIRRKTNGGKVAGYAYDKRYQVRREIHAWVARFDGVILASGESRGAAREVAYLHFLNAGSALAAAA